MMEIEHYRTITDIVAIFKVMEKDTCLFVWISHMLFYLNSMLGVVDQIE